MIDRFIDQQEAAAILNVSDRRVRQMIHEEDPIPTVDGGRVPCEAFGAWFKRRALKGVHVGDDGTVYDLEAERARLTKNQADKAAIDVGIARGELVESAVMALFWGEMIGALRAKILAIPSKLAVECLGMETKQDIEQAAMSVVREALDELAGDVFPEQIRKRMERDSSGLEPDEAASESDGQ